MKQILYNVKIIPRCQTMSRSMFLILVLAGFFILCTGCVSAPEKNNVTISIPAIPAMVSPSLTAATPAICPLREGNNSPWILINPVADHVVGDPFVINGTTSLAPGTTLSVFVVQSQTMANKRRPETYTNVRGSATVLQGNCTANTWTFSENLTTLMPFYYSIYVTAENETIEANYAGFTILDNRTYNY
jgi:hypothetical protein